MLLPGQVMNSLRQTPNEQDQFPVRRSSDSFTLGSHAGQQHQSPSRGPLPRIAHGKLEESVPYGRSSSSNLSYLSNPKGGRSQSQAADAPTYAQLGSSSSFTCQNSSPVRHHLNSIPSYLPASSLSMPTSLRNGSFSMMPSLSPTPINGAETERPVVKTNELDEAKERARLEAARRKATATEEDPLKRQISKQEKEKAVAVLARSYLKSWLRSHKALVRPPKMHDNVRRVISAWFNLVDADGGGSLDSNELLTALKAAGIPCDDNTILEMIKMMDLNSDGEISWEEFEAFMCNEFAAGKTLLSGEYVLPSGTSLPFGAMVTKMKRNRMMEDIMEGGERRQKWVNLMNNAQALHEELHLFADADGSQDGERQQSEKEGRALNALAAMCEQEEAAAAATIKASQPKLTADQEEAQAAAAIIEAAEKRAEAARQEADAAHRAAAHEAAERRVQREAKEQLLLEPPKDENALGQSPQEPAPIHHNFPPRRSASSSLGGPAAEAQVLADLFPETDFPPHHLNANLFPSTPSALVAAPSVLPSAPPLSKQSSASSLPEEDSAASTPVFLPMPAINTRSSRLSVVMEGEKEGKGESPVDSPTERDDPAASMRTGSTSYKSLSSRGASSSSKGRAEGLNTEGRAAAREAAAAAALAVAAADAPLPTSTHAKPGPHSTNSHAPSMMRRTPLLPVPPLTQSPSLTLTQPPQDAHPRPSLMLAPPKSGAGAYTYTAASIQASLTSSPPFTSPTLPDVPAVAGGVRVRASDSAMSSERLLGRSIPYDRLKSWQGNHKLSTSQVPSVYKGQFSSSSDGSDRVFPSTSVPQLPRMGQQPQNLTPGGRQNTSPHRGLAASLYAPRS